MKAWHVDAPNVEYDWDEGMASEIVRAETRTQAIQAARNRNDRLGDLEWIDLRARREPHFDNVPITKWNMFLTGDWWFDCEECGQKVYSDCDDWDLDLDEPRVPTKSSLGFDAVYCSARCEATDRHKYLNTCRISYTPRRNNARGITPMVNDLKGRDGWRAYCLAMFWDHAADHAEVTRLMAVLETMGAVLQKDTTEFRVDFFDGPHARRYYRNVYADGHTTEHALGWIANEHRKDIEQCP